MISSLISLFLLYFIYFLVCLFSSFLYPKTDITPYFIYIKYVLSFSSLLYLLVNTKKQRLLHALLFIFIISTISFLLTKHIDLIYTLILILISLIFHFTKK